MDSLRYWVVEMHVDGFRFDLAARWRAIGDRRQQVARFLRNHSPGPGAFAGETNRGTVGRGRGRLSGWQFSACPGRNGTANIAIRFAVFGKATRAASARWVTGSPAVPIYTSTMGDARTPASISSPRTMVSP